MKKQEITKIIKKLKACDPIIVNWVDAGDDEPPVTGLVWKSMKDSISSLKAANISGGEKRRLSIAIAMISKPRLILLDEPFSALDPQTIEMIKNLILRLQKFNIACIVSDHQAASILEISDATLILGNGTIIADDTPKRLLADSRARAINFGEHFSSPF